MGFINRNNFPKPTHFNYEQVQEQFVNASEVRDINLDLSDVIFDKSKLISDIVGLDFGNAPTDIMYNVGENTFKRINLSTGESTIDSSVNDKKFSMNDSSIMILDSDDSDRNSEVGLTGVSNDLCLNIEYEMDRVSDNFNPFHQYSNSSVIMSFYKNGILYNIHRGCYITVYNVESKTSTVHSMNDLEKYTDKISNKSAIVYDEFNTAKVITFIDVDSSGNILFSTTNGLYYFNLLSMATSKLAIASSNKVVTYIKCVNDSFIFITTNLNGSYSVSKFHNNVQTEYTITGNVGKTYEKISCIGNTPVLICNKSYAILSSQNSNLIDFEFYISSIFGSSVTNYFIGIKNDPIFGGSIVYCDGTTLKYDISYTDTIIGDNEVSSDKINISYDNESIHIIGYNGSKIEKSSRKNIVSNRDSGKYITNIKIIGDYITITFSDSTSEYINFVKFVGLFTSVGLCINTNTKVMNKLQTKTDMGNIFIFTNDHIIRLPLGDFSQMESDDVTLSDDIETFLNIHVFDTGVDYKACLLSEFKVGSTRFVRSNFISKTGIVITSLDRTQCSIQIPLSFNNFLGSKYYTDSNSVKFFVMDNSTIKSYICNFTNTSIVIGNDTNFNLTQQLLQKNSNILYGSNKYLKFGNLSIMLNDKFTKFYNGDIEVLTIVSNIKHKYIKNIEMYNDVAYISTSESTIVIDLVDILTNTNSRLGYADINASYKSSINNDILAIYDSSTLTVNDIENDVVYHDILNNIGVSIPSFRLDFVERSGSDIYIGIHSIDSVKISAIYILRISGGSVTFEKIDINDEYDLLSTNPRSIPNKSGSNIDNILIYNRGVVYKFLLIDSVMIEKLKPIYNIANNTKFIRFYRSGSDIKILTTSIDVILNTSLIVGVAAYVSDKSCIDSLTIGNDLYTIRRFANNISIYKNNTIVKNISPIVAGVGKITMTHKGNVIIYKTSTYIVLFNMITLSVEFSQPEYNYSNNVRHNDSSLFIAKTCGTIIGNSNGGLYNELEFTTIRGLSDIIYTEDSKCIEYKINKYNLLSSSEVFTASKGSSTITRYKFITIPKMISIKVNEENNHIILTDKVMFETTGSNIIIYGNTSAFDYDEHDGVYQIYYTKETFNKLGYSEISLYNPQTGSMNTISYSDSRYSITPVKFIYDHVYLFIQDHIDHSNCRLEYRSLVDSSIVILGYFENYVKECIEFSYINNSIRFMNMTDDSIFISNHSNNNNINILDESNIEGIPLDYSFVRFEKMSRFYIDIIVSKDGVEYLLPNCKFVEEIDIRGDDIFRLVVSEDIIESSIVRDYYSDEVFGICMGASIENNINSVDSIQYDVMIGKFNQDTTIADIDDKSYKLGIKVPKNVAQPVHFHRSSFNIIQISNSIIIYDESLSILYKIIDLNIFWILKDVKTSGNHILFVFENNVIASIYLGDNMYGKVDSGLSNCTRYNSSSIIFDEVFITDIGYVYGISGNVLYNYAPQSSGFHILKTNVRFVKCDSLNSRLYTVTDTNEFGYIDCEDNLYTAIKNFDSVNVILGLDVSSFNSICVVCKNGLHFYTNDNLHHLYKLDIDDEFGENYKALIYPYKVK